MNRLNHNPQHRAIGIIIVLMSEEFGDIAERLAEVGRRFDRRGWVLGTSGNFSAVLRRDPLRLAVTSSSVFKGELRADQILQIDEDGAVVEGSGRPSAEARLHVEIARTRRAGGVEHDTFRASC
jgi:methylthioribulose-1-phosphate dehydratase